MLKGETDNSAIVLQDTHLLAIVRFTIQKWKKQEKRNEITRRKRREEESKGRKKKWKEGSKKEGLYKH